MDVMSQLPEKSIDSFIVDPPYNIGYDYNEYSDRLNWDEYFEWQLQIFAEAARLLKPTGSILWLNYPMIAAKIWATIAELSLLTPISWITWIYHQHTGGTPLRRATRAWLWFSAGNSPYIDSEALAGEYRNPTDKRVREMIERGHRPVDYDWWFYEQVKNVSPEKIAHPCQLPLAMILRLVKMVTPPDGIVLDPFSGSGTTPVAAKKLSRRWIGVELDKTYVQRSRERLKATSSDLLEER